MKRAIHLAAVALISLASAAGAQTTLSKGDQKFIAKAAMGGMAEVAAAQAALQTSANDPVKEFAQMMVDDHGKANDQLKQIATAKGVTLPDSDPMADRETKTLSKLSGAKFDKRYARMQLKDHASTIKLFKHEAEDGQDPDLKKFASDTLPTLESHFYKANQLASSVMAKKPRHPATQAPVAQQ